MVFFFQKKKKLASRIQNSRSIKSQNLDDIGNWLAAKLRPSKDEPSRNNKIAKSVDIRPGPLLFLRLLYTQRRANEKSTWLLTPASCAHSDNKIRCYGLRVASCFFHSFIPLSQIIVQRVSHLPFVLSFSVFTLFSFSLPPSPPPPLFFRKKKIVSYATKVGLFQAAHKQRSPCSPSLFYTIFPF